MSQGEKVMSQGVEILIQGGKVMIQGGKVKSQGDFFFFFLTTGCWILRKSWMHQGLRTKLEDKNNQTKDPCIT